MRHLVDWVEECIQWDKSRNNLIYNPNSEYDMLAEELQELMEATNSNEEIDALCDIIKVAVSAIWKLGYYPSASMRETLKEINSRKQDPQQKEVWEKWGASGKWLKDVSQDESTKYKADYSKCLYE